MKNRDDNVWSTL